MKAAAVALITICVLGAPSCGTRGSGGARTGDNPHDTDSLYALYHRILVDSDPVMVWSETECEMSRLMDRLGTDEGSRRIKALTETVYTAAEKRRRAEIEPKLWYHDYPLDNASCAKGFEFHYTPDTTAPAIRPKPERED